MYQEADKEQFCCNILIEEAIELKVITLIVKEFIAMFRSKNQEWIRPLETHITPPLMEAIHFQTIQGKMIIKEVPC